LHVLFALTPTAAFAIYAFGLSGAMVLVVSSLACLGAECAFRDDWREALRDGSTLVTGVLYGLTLPPGLPLWMVAVGAGVAIGVGKRVFGGLGSNPFNPALVGRAFLQAAFPSAMTQWLPAFGEGRFLSLPESTLAAPFLRPTYDIRTTATPLASWKFAGEPSDWTDLALGLTPGSLGETSSVLIVLGGVYLVARNVMSWRIPIAVCGSVALISFALHQVAPDRHSAPAAMLFSGGLMHGAVFMATDLVGSPMTHLGGWIYGGAIGALVVVIRGFGGMPEGVMYAILLGNASTPLIDHWIRPRPYGDRPGVGR